MSDKATFGSGICLAPDPGWQLGVASYTLRTLSLSVLHGSPNWSELLIEVLGRLATEWWFSGDRRLRIFLKETWRLSPGFRKFHGYHVSIFHRIRPTDIRELGGAISADRRCGRVITYHNTAPCFYSGRAFRGSLRV